MKKDIKQPLQALGLIANFFGLSTFFHNYFSSFFASEERFFLTLSVILACCLPIPLVYIGIVYSVKMAKGKRKSRWERLVSVFKD